MLSRRHLLALTASGLAVNSVPRAGFAAIESEKRLVVVILRGAMDGLAAVPAYGDADFVGARRGLAGPPPGEAGGALKLDALFALHPNLRFLHELYQAEEAVIVHAAATPYRDRSHFDGQNLLENGSEQPFGLETGWLNRVLSQMPGGGRPLGIALNSHLPLLLRGPADVTSWAPSLLPPPDQDTAARLAALYQATDPALAVAFAKARSANEGMATANDGNYASFPILCQAAAKFLSDPAGPRLASLEISGWDSHVNQAGAYSPLSSNLLQLDQGLRALKQGLGAAWSETVVMMVSEFGRTVAMNGTQGTDHGTGGAFFLAGGALRGGRVMADWPGLKPPQLYMERDLRPTSDFRAYAQAILRDHLGLQGQQLAAIFPAAAPIKPVDGLLRS